ncbi:MAG: hypothetical protein Q7U57_12440 [Methylovulum sp.]|nr:hypothetical protein [Methylovulum sp.]
MQININIAVDVIGALSDQTLHNHLFMMDNSVFNSTGQGTDGLSTLCRPGQVIQWVAYAIDLQTPVSIKNISFIGADNKHDIENDIDPISGNPDLNAWTGIVPWYMELGMPYKYKLALQMGEGANSILYADTASLMRV